MGRTLFLYIFKDLLRSFLLAAIGLTMIMSFGGLLKPLTKQGLDVAQMGWMLVYLMPAMTTYALPIAALFATTMVYGRLSADNEMNACRASGISYLAMTTPAILLGLAVALISLLLLCFIVPIFTLQMERVLYSNISQLIATQIDRTHEITFNEVTIYADDARVIKPPPDMPNMQIVELISPTVVTLQPSAQDPTLSKPKEFMTARQATAFIRENPDSQVTLEVQLKGGISFPRDLAGGSQVSIGTTSFGPVPIPSSIRENTKFMTINQLKRILADPMRSREISGIVTKGVQQAQVDAYLASIAQRLHSGDRTFTFATGSERTTIRAAATAPELRDNSVIISYNEDPQKREVGFVEITLPTSAAGNERILQAVARQIRITAQLSSTPGSFDINIELRDTMLEGDTGPTARPLVQRSFRVPIPPPVAAIHQLAPDSPAAQLLQRRQARLINYIIAEIHARLSFTLSCLILMLVGAALGSLFRSGNILSAFAVSAIPAVLCVALIVTGQHTAENLPSDLSKMSSVLRLGISLIYSGNLLILILAIYLTLKLQRQ